jgi:DNA-binding NarL/FixJ family response regulator
VLVADDSEPIRQVLGQLVSGLRRLELVGEASDGLQTLDAIKRLKPDVVILDIRMPRMNGLEVLEAIQSEGTSCKVIVFSQFGDESYRKKCAQLGAHAFFDKIAEIEAFQLALKRLPSEVEASP